MSALTFHWSLTRCAFLLLQATAQAAAANPEAVSHVLAQSFVASAKHDAAVTDSFAAATAQAFRVAKDRGSHDLDSFSTAMAVASTRAAAVDAAAAARTLAALAAQVLSAGVQEAFTQSQAMALSVSRQQGNIGPYAATVASAIQDGGFTATQVYGKVFAKAIAAGGSQAAALAGGMKSSFTTTCMVGLILLSVSLALMLLSCRPGAAVCTLAACNTLPGHYSKVMHSQIWEWHAVSCHELVQTQNSRVPTTCLACCSCYC